MFKQYAFHEGFTKNMIVNSTLKLAVKARKESKRLNRRPFSIFEYYTGMDCYPSRTVSVEELQRQ